MPIAAVRQTRLYRQIADQLQRLIRDGEFPPGTKLPAERELSQMLGVSRASVREALIALEVVGDVEVRVGHGVVVLGGGKATTESVMRAAAQSELWRIDPEFAGEIELNLDEEIPPFALLQRADTWNRRPHGWRRPMPRTRTVRPCVQRWRATWKTIRQSTAIVSSATGCCISVSPKHPTMPHMHC